VMAFFDANRTQVQVMSFAYSLGALALLAFVAYGAGLLVGDDVRAAGDQTPSSALSMLAIGAGTLAVGFWLLTGLLLWILAQSEATASAGGLRVLHDLAYLTGGPAHVVTLGAFIGAVSLAAWRTGVLPRWVAVVGVATGVLSMLSLAALLWAPASLILPLGRGLSFLWILATSVAAVWVPAGSANRARRNHAWSRMQSPGDGLRS
jgi:hypothetical protein